MEGKKAKDLNRRFSKEDLQMVNRRMKRCSTTLVVREAQIKTTRGYYLIPDRMAIMKQVRDTKCW